MPVRLTIGLLAAIFLFHLAGCANSRPTVLLTGAAGDGKTNDTGALQAALDRCAAAGGGEVIVPAGNYSVGSVQLKSNTTLKLDETRH